jgi:hypothetical protein
VRPLRAANLLGTSSAAPGFKPKSFYPDAITQINRENSGNGNLRALSAWRHSSLQNWPRSGEPPVSKLGRDCVSHDFQIIPAKKLQLTGGRIFGRRFKRDRNNLVHGIRSEHEATLDRPNRACLKSAKGGDTISYTSQELDLAFRNSRLQSESRQPSIQQESADNLHSPIRSQDFRYSD